MTDGRFDYHRHLEDIALEDVAFLKKKDTSYGASWKRSGRSAWFMLKRMLDRLDAMMARPAAPPHFSIQLVDNTIEHKFGNQGNLDCLRHLRDAYLSEDVLAKMEVEATQSDPRSEMPDGTVYAVLRDLRRYCLLCDAEIRERTLARKSSLPIYRKFVEAIASQSIETGDVVRVEDSNRHADRSKVETPWCVDRKWRFDMGYGDSGRKAEFDTWWTQRTPDRWIPKEYVEVDYGHSPPAILAPLYICVTNDDGQRSRYILDLTKCPSSIRSSYVKLQQECNGAEYMALAPHWRGLYWYDNDQGKWRLGERYVRWTSWQ